MRDWLPYTGAFGLALASAIGGYFLGFRIVMSGSGFGVAGFFALAILMPLSVAFAVFVISYAAFSDRWIGWLNGLVAVVCVFVAALVCFTLIVLNVSEEGPAATLLMLMLFFGGRFALKRADLA